MNNQTIHPSIGPHEGKELFLMLENKKEIALFYSDSEIPVEFNHYIESNRFFLKTVSIEVQIKRFTIDFFIIYQKNCDEKVEKLVYYIKESINSKKFDPYIERNIGRLLGYSENDINFYIEHSLNLKKNLIRKNF